MPFGRKARHVKAYQFGASAPQEGMEAVLAQHRLRTDYYNALVEMELRQREERAALLSQPRPWHEAVLVPIGLAQELVLRDAGLRERLDQLRPAPGDIERIAALNLQACDVAALLPWNLTKGAYLFDPDLFDSLVEAPLETSIWRNSAAGWASGQPTGSCGSGSSGPSKPPTPSWAKRPGGSTAQGAPCLEDGLAVAPIVPPRPVRPGPGG